MNNPIFPDIPEPTARQRAAVTFGNRRVADLWLRKPRTLVELKRAIIVEAEDHPGRQDILMRLLPAYSKAERRRITDAIDRLKHRKP